MRTWYNKNNELLCQIKNTKLCDDELAIWYVGQCGMIIKSDKMMIGIDIMFNDLVRSDGSSARTYEWPCAPESMYLDYALCTHGHLDHMCIPTLQGFLQCNPNLKVIVPDGCCQELIDAGFSKHSLIGLNQKEQFCIDGLVLDTIQAAHPVHTVTEEGKDIALSYSIHMQNIHILHTGDTYLTDQYWSDLQQLSQIDIFMAPINGGDYFRTSNDIIGNLSPIETAKMAAKLDVRLMIPMHFDMVMGNTVDVFDFCRLLWEQKNNAAFCVPALGERIIYKK